MNYFNEKHKQLDDIMHSFDSVLVAFSGGVDSALVLKLAHDALKNNCAAFTSDSPSVPRSELDIARQIAASIGAQHSIVETKELENPDYSRNPVNRCYFCKSSLYSAMVQHAKAMGIAYILNGTNADDASDYRPGLRAADELKVRSPLKDAGMTKNDVRELAHHLKIEVWDKPASPCLSSRIPYGQPVTPEKLSMIEAAEAYLKSFGIVDLRVRHFGTSASIEVLPEDTAVIQGNYESIRNRFKQIGFPDFSVKNFFSGSLNRLAGIR